MNPSSPTIPKEAVNPGEERSERIRSSRCRAFLPAQIPTIFLATFRLGIRELGFLHSSFAAIKPTQQAYRLGPELVLSRAVQRFAKSISSE